MRTELENLGEFGLINIVKEAVKLKNESSKLGIGDDAAVVKYDNDKLTVISTDMLVEGIHFDLSYCPLKHLGYKAVVSNVSDMCAMNAKAKQITVSVALSNRFSLEAFEELYQGILLAAEFYGVDVIGGDTSSSKSGLIISITVLGEVLEENLVKRSGSTDKELLVVTGDLGAAYMGLQILEREKSVWKDSPGVQPDLEGYDYILERQLKPEARHDIIALFEKLEIKPTAMIDVSDGLASEVIHICKSSNVGCKLYEEKIPIDPQTVLTAQEFELDPSLTALNGGEDYELLFTAKQADYDKIKDNPNFTIIGYITDASEGISLVTRSGQEHPLTAQGWDAFLNKNN